VKSKLLGISTHRKQYYFTVQKATERATYEDTHNNMEHKGEQIGITASWPDNCRFVWNVAAYRHYF
jgi:hypothetical protein